MKKINIELQSFEPIQAGCMLSDEMSMVESTSHTLDNLSNNVSFVSSSMINKESKHYNVSVYAELSEKGIKQQSSDKEETQDDYPSCLGAIKDKLSKILDSDLSTTEEVVLKTEKGNYVTVMKEKCAFCTVIRPHTNRCAILSILAGMAFAMISIGMITSGILTTN